jgi:hypothetical protein
MVVFMSGLLRIYRPSARALRTSLNLCSAAALLEPIRSRLTFYFVHNIQSSKLGLLLTVKEFAALNTGITF